MKEKLTRDIIKKEIRRLYVENICFEMVTCFVFFFIVHILSVEFYQAPLFFQKEFARNVGIFLEIIILVYFFINVLKDILKIMAIYGDKFLISTDSLVNHGHTVYFVRGSRNLLHYTLFFKSFGEFKILQRKYPKKWHYTWSNEYKMNDKMIYETSSPGDEFYIISFDYKKPVFVYNKKFFDLQDE